MVRQSIHGSQPGARIPHSDYHESVRQVRAPEALKELAISWRQPPVLENDFLEGLGLHGVLEVLT